MPLSKDERPPRLSLELPLTRRRAPRPSRLPLLSLLLFSFGLPSPGRVVVLALLLLFPVSLAPRLVDPWPTALHVSAVCEAYLPEEGVHPVLLPERGGRDALPPWLPREDEHPVGDEIEQ